VNVALAVVAAVLIIAALVLVGVAALSGRSLSRARASEPAEIYSPAPAPTPNWFSQRPNRAFSLPAGEVRQISGTGTPSARRFGRETAGLGARTCGWGGREGGESHAAFVGWLLARQTPGIALSVPE